MSKARRGGLRSTLPLVYLDLLEALGTSRALALAISYRHNALFENLDLLEVDPHGYRDAHSYWADAQSVAIFKKNLHLKGYKTSDELHSDSILRFFHLEEINRRNNLDLYSLKSFRDVSLIERVKRIIIKVLGYRPPSDRYRPMFGPGSTYLLPACQSTIADKLDNSIDATPHALIYLQECMSASPRLFPYFSNPIVQVPGNRFSSVEKDFKKRRPISIEPMFNMLLQKNIGDFIRHRLKRVGIDIPTQQDLHKFVLLKFHDVYATIDQSDASDRICSSLVKILLPPDWYTYLDRIRSRFTIICDTKIGPPKKVELEKFASQGNGFIFELETLIFYAIAQATVDMEDGESNHFISAYGDDVIVPEAFFSAVVTSYESLGFSVNKEKSFGSGPFKESCGVDVFNGIEVRPFYLKEFTHGLAGIYEAANYVTRLASRHLNNVGYCSFYKRAWLRIVSLIKENRRYGGPEELGDSVLHGWKPAAFSKGGIRYTKGIKRSYRRKDYRLPMNEQSLLAYIVFGYADTGVLPRSAPFSTEPTCYVLTQVFEQKTWV